MRKTDFTLLQLPWSELGRKINYIYITLKHQLIYYWCFRRRHSEIDTVLFYWKSFLEQSRWKVCNCTNVMTKPGFQNFLLLKIYDKLFCGLWLYNAIHMTYLNVYMFWSYKVPIKYYYWHARTFNPALNYRLFVA